ncbi:putative endonuclease [Flavobacteriaceae bacterium MAR_2010_188]|nr:putative endonuclease [Flavobacteriaceae bacterium MAR_2010_188]
MYYAYVIKSLKDGRLYKGITDNLDRRIERHNLGENKSTKGFIPWKLYYYEIFDTRIEARSRERFFKSGYGREFLTKIKEE